MERSKSPKPPRRSTRASRSDAIRASLISAAVEIVGQDGYASASVSKITMRADVAQGTFYNYFGSRDELLRELLPRLGDVMLDRIRTAAASTTDAMAQEKIRIETYFQFIIDHPGFPRILKEAEAFYPDVYLAHFRRLAQGYMRALGRSSQAGQMPNFEEADLEPLAYILMGARDALTFRYLSAEGGSGDLASVVRTYERMLRFSLFKTTASR